MNKFFLNNWFKLGVLTLLTIISLILYSLFITQSDINADNGQIKTFEEAVRDNKIDDFESVVGNYPKASSTSIPAQWFMMDSFLSEIKWQKMMFVFGYGDNRAVCEHLSEVAKAEAPERNFKCEDVN